MSADEIRVEAVARRKSQKSPMVRHWRGEELVAATCRECGKLKPAEELVANRRRSGGRDLRCRACLRDASASRRADPAVREQDRKNYRRRVASGLAAEDKRRVRTLRAARTPEEVAAKRAELRPDGLKRCRDCREWLALGAFYGDTSTADGLRESCLTCDAAARGARRYGPFLASWEDRDLWTCVYTGLPYDDADHVIPRSGPDTKLDLDSPANLVPSSWQANRGPGGKFERPVLDFVEELHGSGVIDWLLAGGVIERPLPAA